ncbi:ATP-grasp domain-containing protein [Kribbella sp. NPDC005582]|uniref:ATP-grasp domain-containing protein n=1 Tax=Kribbella sp. NPDC005582 TaxID=3156893 RepID=UPI0033B463B3
MHTLLTSGQQTSTAILLAEAARVRGLSLRAADNLSGLREHIVHWYGGPAAAARVADVLDLKLLEPPDDWLVKLPESLAGRRIDLTTAAIARTRQGPAFLKPPRDKTFPATVYSDGSELPDLPPDTPVLISEVVTFAAEYRLFVLDGEVVTGSRYATFGHLDVGPLVESARTFALDVIADLPSAVVVDVGQIADPATARRRWAVVEANMPWFAQSYGADPARVLDVILRATGPLSQFSPVDRRFLGLDNAADEVQSSNKGVLE